MSAALKTVVRSELFGTRIYLGIWNEIARMQRTGIFGMLGELRSDFTFTGTYPLATLGIDRDLLEAKWERTHPAFAKRRNT